MSSGSRLAWDCQCGGINVGLPHMHYEELIVVCELYSRLHESVYDYTSAHVFESVPCWSTLSLTLPGLQYA